MCAIWKTDLENWKEDIRIREGKGAPQLSAPAVYTGLCV